MTKTSSFPCTRRAALFALYVAAAVSTTAANNSGGSLSLEKSLLRKRQLVEGRVQSRCAAKSTDGYKNCAEYDDLKSYVGADGLYCETWGWCSLYLANNPQVDSVEEAVVETPPATGEQDSLQVDSIEEAVAERSSASTAFSTSMTVLAVVTTAVMTVRS